MDRIAKGWNFVRGIRLALGLYILLQSVLTREWVLACAGLFLSVTAVFNVGCCGIYGCQPMIRAKIDPNKEITYEEVDA